MNRREVLLSAPPAVVAGTGIGAVTTCSSSGIQIDPNILVEINKAVATGCNFIPAITTVIALINAAFPAVLGATTIVQSTLNEIVNMLCQHAQAGKLGGAPLNANGTDVPVHGWIVKDGKLVYV